MTQSPHPRALVTGAGVRIGRAIALDLGQAGFDVAVHYGRSADAADEVVGLLRDMGRQAVAVRADLTQEAEVGGLVAAAAQGLGGPLTCLVNNASVFERDTIQDATRASWDKHMEANLRAPFRLIQDFAGQCPAPLRDGTGEPVAAGSVVNLIDQRVRKLTPDFMSYTLSRAALWTLTQTAAQALAPRIRVNAVGPGPTLRNTGQSEQQFADQRAATILERGSDPQDIVAAVRYLTGAKAVTGQFLCVDGGQHLGWETPDVVGLE
ncbi:SDR family oxidoreductase [Pseudooceanicola onchidii]|uniref:SDR family oxidoreductase n=1 Tax=Pseudooceanicola onchidii TaxID=2562279 RepID=UPI0010A9CD7A|nr:SDR family oxidoreductase [Pseudooceanicola onchidii]